jgi:ABC-type dipeptide/oligopeptide/nickel transport system permease subunit
MGTRTTIQVAIVLVGIALVLGHQAGKMMGWWQ